eukprot:12993526-Ditylum_brightwellii.AAC.1
MASLRGLTDLTILNGASKSNFSSQDDSAETLLRDTLLRDTSQTKVSPASEYMEINKFLHNKQMNKLRIKLKMNCK